MDVFRKFINNSTGIDDFTLSDRMTHHLKYVMLQYFSLKI